MFRLEKLSHPLHSSWLLSFASTGLLAGIIISYASKSTYFSATYWLVIPLAMLAIVIIRQKIAMIILAILAGLVLGLWRGANVQLASVSYDEFIGQAVMLTGTVADDVTKKNGQSGITLENVTINNKSLGSKAWIGASTSLNLKRGDRITANGKLEPGFGNFAASISHAKIVSASRDSASDIPRKIRDKFTNGLKKTVNEPEASLGAGYLDGQHNDLPDQLVEQLKLVGLIHLVIAGGYNVTILVRLVRRLFAKISKYMAALGGFAILFGILTVTGFSAPMSRTVVITTLSMLAWYYGRKFHPLVLLLVSAAITALIDPTFVQGQLGWYLTFIAYGGLILLGPMLQKYFWDTPSGTLRQIFVDTLSVQIVTFPLLAFAFQQYSIYGLPANLLVLPLMPLTMLLSVIAGIGGMFLPLSIAHIIGYPAQILLAYTYKITTWLAGSPGADYSANFSLPLMVASYSLIALVIYWLWRKTKYNFREENILI